MSGIIPPPSFLSSAGEPPMDWEVWEPVFLAYVVLEGEECEPERKLALLKHCLGGIGLKEFKTLPALSNPGNINVYEYASLQLNLRYGKKKNIVMERFIFYSRKQRADKSIEDFVSALRSLAVTCDFEHISYEQVLRDQILMRTNNKKVQERLCTTSDMSLSAAIDIAKSIEHSKKCVR